MRNSAPPWSLVSLCKAPGGSPRANVSRGDQRPRGFNIATGSVPCRAPRSPCQRDGGCHDAPGSSRCEPGGASLHGWIGFVHFLVCKVSAAIDAFKFVVSWSCQGLSYRFVRLFFRCRIHKPLRSFFIFFVFGHNFPFHFKFERRQRSPVKCAGPFFSVGSCIAFTRGGSFRVHLGEARPRRRRPACSSARPFGG